jgi:O-antigen ligase
MRSRVGSHPVALVLAAGIAVGLGAATLLGGAAVMSGSLVPAFVAGAVGGAAFVTAVSLGWLEPLWIIVLALPLPALYSTDTLRIPLVVAISAAAAVGWGLHRGLDQRPLVPVSGAARSMVALVLAMLVSAVFADRVGPAAREAVNFLLFGAIFLIALDRVCARPAQGDAIATCVAVAAAVAGLAAAVEAVGLAPGRFPLAGTSFYRAAGGFGWPNELAMFFAVSFPLAVYRLRVVDGFANRMIALGLIGAAGVGLVSTFSRGSWLAVVLAPGVLLFTGEGRLVLRFWGVLLLGATVADLVTGGALSTRIIDTPADPFVAQRLLLTGAGLLMFQSSPIVGVGPGGFPDALQAFGPQISGLFDFVGSAHNGYVHVGAEAGIIGLVAFLYLVIGTWMVLLRGARAPLVSGDDPPAARARALRVALLWSFTTACIVSLFEWPFGHGIGELIVIVAAAGRALAHAHERARRSAPA